MEYTHIHKLARVLRVLVLIVFVCNLLALLLVPGLAALSADGGIDLVAHAVLSALNQPGYEGQGFVSLPLFMVLAWVGVWSETYTVLMTAFLWICGISTAVILWQAKRVLDSILKAEIFSVSNAIHLRRAAVCCFVISGTSLLWAICRAALGGIFELFSLSTLFFPVFFLAALLFLVMSALFRQAAELKAENDLTI
jgi:hypothetical protein